MRKVPMWIKEDYTEVVSYEPNRIEKLFQGNTTIEINAPLALIELQVQTEIALLIRLKRENMLSGIDTKRLDKLESLKKDTGKGGFYEKVE